jgi:hypothetical protein
MMASSPGHRYYYCSTRHKKHGCNHPLTTARPIEEQITRFLAEFRASQAILERLTHGENVDTEDVVRKHRQLSERLRELCPRRRGSLLCRGHGVSMQGLQRVLGSRHRQAHP